eukprot:TRINITY_DN4924_c0_g1_i1.p1 TRINITY_DN4924_c0_g1~~TRINITY_DN4924_c0_g1_i1.p1  ORF type:complete len:277 (-),score=41.08 TRINITY_DN4924_c0_g1_i1:83-817(-)
MVQEDLGSNATGILLAILGNFLISLSLNITKHAHNINQNGPHPEVPYTQMPIWWLGMMTMALGELGNFTAYAFAPATLVSPLGAVTIIANAMLASTFLGETMRRRDKVGCVFTVLGGVILVMFAPQVSSSSLPCPPFSLLYTQFGLPYVANVSLMATQPHVMACTSVVVANSMSPSICFRQKWCWFFLCVFFLRGNVGRTTVAVESSLWLDCTLLNDERMSCGFMCILSLISTLFYAVLPRLWM